MAGPRSRKWVTFLFLILSVICFILALILLFMN